MEYTSQWVERQHDRNIVSPTDTAMTHPAETEEELVMTNQFRRIPTVAGALCATAAARGRRSLAAGEVSYSSCPELPSSALQPVIPPKAPHKRLGSVKNRVHRRHHHLPPTASSNNALVSATTPLAELINA